MAENREKRKISHASASSLTEKVARMNEPPFLGTLQALMKDGAFSKAVRHLLSDVLHDANDSRVQDKIVVSTPPKPRAHFGIPPGSTVVMGYDPRWHQG